MQKKDSDLIWNTNSYIYEYLGLVKLDCDDWIRLRWIILHCVNSALTLRSLKTFFFFFFYIHSWVTSSVLQMNELPLLKSDLIILWPLDSLPWLGNRTSCFAHSLRTVIFIDNFICTQWFQWRAWYPCAVFHQTASDIQGKRTHGTLWTQKI